MNQLYEDWLEAKHQLNSFKKKELRLRNEIIDNQTNERKLGKTKVIDGDYKLEIIRGIAIKLNEAELDGVYKTLSEEEKAAIKYKPSIVQSEFKKLKGNESLFDCITEKPSQPTLKIIIDE